MRELQPELYANRRRAPAFTMRGSRSRMPYGFAWREATVGFHQFGSATPLIHRVAPSFSMRPSLPERHEQSGPKRVKALVEAEKAYEAARAAAQHAEKNGLPAEMQASLRQGQAAAKQSLAAAKAASKAAPKGANSDAYSPPATLSRMRRAPSYTMGSPRTGLKPAVPDARASHDASIDKATRLSSPGFTMSTTPRFKADRAAILQVQLGPGAHSPYSKQTGKAAIAYTFGPPPSRRASAAVQKARAELKRKLNAATVVSSEEVALEVEEGVNELVRDDSVSAL